MQSWVIKAAKNITLTTEESNEVNLKTHAKVKIARAPISQNDLLTFEGKYNNLPIIPARGGVGFISESKLAEFSKGLRVYISPYLQNKDNIEIMAKTCDGILSDFATIPNTNIHVLPENISDEAFSFVDDVALCLKAFKLIKFKETDYIVFYGATTLNMIMAQIAIYYQAIPIIIDSDEKALSIAEDYGIYYCINSSNENVNKKLVEITAGKMGNVLIIDTDFNEKLDIDILKNVAINGKVGFIGYNLVANSTIIDVCDIINKGLSVYAISDGIGEVEQAINMLTTKIVQVDKMVEKIYEFEETFDAFTSLYKQKNRLKYLIRC